MDRRIKSLILTIFGAALLLVVATMGCKNPLLDTVKGEVSTFLEGDPEISIMKGIIDIPSGGEVDIGSAQVDQPGDPKIATFTVLNMGNGDLKLAGTPIIAIDTANPNEFKIGIPPNSTIASGTNSSFTIEFTPQGSAGARSAILSIDNNDSDENPYTFTITGTATLGPEPEIQVQQGTTIIDENQPYTYDFSCIEVDTQANVEFTIYNYGTPGTDLYLTGSPRVAIIGADASQFSVNPYPGSPIHQGNSSPFTVIYQPNAEGNHSATVRIANDDSDENPYEFTITGSGLIIGLPRTGQTTSYETGDDGDMEMGVAWPIPRFTDNGNGTISDNLTGLMWDKTGNRFGTSTWAQALIDCNGLDLGGHGDWRLPNASELRSLINDGQEDSTTWLNGQGFSNVQFSSYWSSTTYAYNTSSALRVHLGIGAVSNGNKTQSLYVLAVRSGQAGGAVSLPKTGQTTSYETGDDGDLQMGAAWPSPRFTDNGNGTITDSLTGLIWDQNGNRFGQSTWAQALTDCNDLDLGGHGDWRLPNVIELKSLINAGQADSAAWLNGQGFSNVEDYYYWPSTTYAPNTTYAWYVDMLVGGVGSYTKTSNYYVLAVRAGQ